MTPIYLVDKIVTRHHGILQMASGDCQFFPKSLTEVEITFCNNGVIYDPSDALFALSQVDDVTVKEIYYTILLPFFDNKSGKVPSKKYRHPFKRNDCLLVDNSLVCERNHLVGWYLVDDLFPKITAFPKTKCIQFIA